VNIRTKYHHANYCRFDRWELNVSFGCWIVHVKSISGSAEKAILWCGEILGDRRGDIRVSTESRQAEMMALCIRPGQSFLYWEEPTIQLAVSRMLSVAYPSTTEAAEERHSQPSSS
jgi:hypothetical protein